MESELLIYFEISFFFNPHIVPFIFPIKRSDIYIYIFNVSQLERFTPFVREIGR